MNGKERIELFKNTVLEFTKERSLMHGAALSYYSILAFIPALYLAITYVGKLVGNDTIISIISSFLKEWIGVKDSGEVIGFLNQVDFENGSLVLQIVGILALLFSCSAIFNSLRRSLNTFYDIDRIEVERKRVIVRNLTARLISMFFVVGVTLVFVIIYFAETMFMSISTEWLAELDFVNRLFLYTMNHGVPILTNLILFSFLFKFMHDGVVGWKNALKGGLVTSILLYIGQLLIKFYLTNFFFAANGGVAGTMLVILVWVYYSSQIIFLGAKFVAVLSRMKGTPIAHRQVKS